MAIQKLFASKFCISLFIKLNGELFFLGEFLIKMIKSTQKPLNWISGAFLFLNSLKIS